MSKSDKTNAGENNFGQDVEFLSRHVETIVLSNDEGGSIAVVPYYQGRTMTSSSRGDEGTSSGWINYEFIESGKRDPKVNLYGGEDRFWISPEGGQYSVFFDPDAPLDFEHWRTPAPIDWMPMHTVETTADSIHFRSTGNVYNRNKFQFVTQLDRTVKLLSRADAETKHGIDCSDLSVVAHESHNTISNVGNYPWRPEFGLISVWILCMNKPSPDATMVVPFKRAEEIAVDAGEEVGPPCNADYFGKLDSSRLVVDEDESLIYLLGDGNLRSKLGVTHERACPVMGSWDSGRGVLTIADFTLPDFAPNGYTNNLWEIQDDPYAGDVINAYNDGPNDSGGKLGGFYELESLGPALALEPRDSYTHVHRTIRLEGPRDALSAVAVKVFGVNLDRIESRLKV